MARSCCEGATAACNCVVEADPASPTPLTVVQNTPGIYTINVDSTAVLDLCASLQSLQQEFRPLLASDRMVVIDAADECQLVDGSTSAVSGSLPPGVIQMFGGTVAPAGYLLCDGGYYDTIDYAALYNVIGIAYGTSGGDFRVPSMAGRVPIGQDGTHILGSTHGLTDNENRLTAVEQIPEHGHASGTLATGAENRDHTHAPPGTAEHFMTRDAGNGLGDYGAAGTSAVNNSVTSGALYNLGSGDQWHTHPISGSTGNAGWATTNPFDVENKNIAVNFIIKT